MLGDPSLFVSWHREDLLHEAEQARLAAQVVQPPWHVRHGLALACHRLADWLDGPDRYVSASDPGPADWMRGSASA